VEEGKRKKRGIRQKKRDEIRKSYLKGAKSDRNREVL
jgi:hypothetical protein